MRLVVESPIGPLGVTLDGPVVVGVRFGAQSGSPTSPGPSPGLPSPGPPSPHPVADELAAYFAGTLTDFTVPVELRGGSVFERAV